ncbi:MAG: hypothetical protein K6A90_15145 [Lachnospiraceae bacterium]|nr:hypothetical protein [Lachnospiraceae bacterium]
MMKETVIRNDVAIGDRVFSVMRDFVAQEHERYSIDETIVTDVSDHHGFVMKTDENIWKSELDIGDTVFFTLDDALRSIRSNSDYQGCCIYEDDGPKWILKKEG